MAKWKPTFYRTNGHHGATAPLRKVAQKFLTNMKHRNEELGNYINPVQRFQYDDNKFVISSLEGYDIVDITVPFEPGEEEVGGAAEIYSGLWEPRFQSHSIGHYLQWYPSGYELYNSSLSNPVPAGLGASVDGNAEEVASAPLPPLRWMRNDYAYDPEDPATREEAPWFKDTGRTVSATSIHPGKYSGKLRELVQMQLGYGLLPQFSYSASNSNGIHLETLDEDTTRIWLYQISATNGVVGQIMMDYSPAKFEKAAELKTGNIPPEIEEAGFMALQTSFDVTKPLYTKAEWDALPDAERPGITTVTFELLSAASYLAVTSEYGAYGDYGWSFNPAGTSAVICGMAWNTPPGGGFAPNYKSNILTVSIDISAFTANVSGGGDNPFLMNSSFDHVKFPNSNGTLETVYFWKGENGFKGTQPSASYTSPIYTYYNLNGALVTCSYQWNEGTTETSPNVGGDPRDWVDTQDCRQLTTKGEETGINYHYRDCPSGVTSGTGTFNQIHGFTTQITGADSYSVWSGGESLWGPVKPYADLAQDTWFGDSYDKRHPTTPLWSSAIYVPHDQHWVGLYSGNFGGSTKSVLIIPSFERLAFYHYKELNTNLTSGQYRLVSNIMYERGQPARRHGSVWLGDDCEYISCGTGRGVFGTPDSDFDTTAEYYITRINNSYRFDELHRSCSPNEGLDCFSYGVLAYPTDVKQSQNPEGFDNTTYTGGLMLPDGSSIAFSEDEIVNQSSPFRESSSSFGYQSVVSLFDTFSGKYIFSMPEIAMTARKHTATGFPDDITKVGVLFSGMPYFL